MSSNHDLDDESFPSREELAGARKDAEEYLHLWQRRALYSTVAFILSCAAVYPFLYGHSLHAHWESFGKYLIFLSMALFIPFVISMGIAINSWISLRNVRRGRF